ncbi:hypothetical protein ASG29_12235 [Sphingomonas sp. Leaf412]|uniref:hypothetical protein n=1 Tax=Sphingomonas sp. Leaf412 TaxID=1736370 RepID=UPI0006F2F066|nr:hypothetical protein [Sphingomonas sp. Leaf412]KQT32530.1 hypothetical protein ASG29_12235 [Sphingomonas sp. Leaf412]
MRSPVSLAAALFAATTAPALAQTPPLPPEAGTPAGPSGTAGMGAPSRYDAVMWGQVDPALTGIAVATGAVPAGDHVEVTVLATGRTILLPVVAGTPALALSPDAARLLGIDARAGVRVRAVTADPADAAALRRGSAAAARLDTPEPVLRALRRGLPAAAATAPSRLRVPRAPALTVADAAPPPPTALRPDAGARTVVVTADVPPTRLIPPTDDIVAAAAVPARFVVNVQTVAKEGPARDAARMLRGTAARGPDGWLVRLGPFDGLPAAQAARDDAVSRGYADAAIFIADRVSP